MSERVDPTMARLDESLVAALRDVTESTPAQWQVALFAIMSATAVTRGWSQEQFRTWLIAMSDATFQSWNRAKVGK